MKLHKIKQSPVKPRQNYTANVSRKTDQQTVMFTRQLKLAAHDHRANKL